MKSIHQWIPEPAYVPHLAYDFHPPFLFDCRLRGADGSTRRMGLGDQIVTIGLIQHVARLVGPENVWVWYNTYYPGARPLWDMSGLSVLPVTDDMTTETIAGMTIIPMRHHIMEDPAGGRGPCLYGAQEGSPLAQALFNLGWHEIVRWSPTEIELTPSEYDRATAAAAMFEWSGCVIACQPLEVTRGNRRATPQIWKQTLCGLNRSFYNPTFAFGCSYPEREAMQAFIDAMDLPLSWNVVIVTKSLPVWKAIIDQASHLVTGNTSGMWLGIASETPMTIIGEGDQQHGIMWDAKPSWFTETRLKTVHAQTWQHFQNTLPVPSECRQPSSPVATP